MSKYTWAEYGSNGYYTYIPTQEDFAENCVWLGMQANLLCDLRKVLPNANPEVKYYYDQETSWDIQVLKE